MSTKLNLGISAACLIAVVVVIVVVIAYMDLAIKILNVNQDQSKNNTKFLVFVNDTLITGQGKANLRGNATLNAINLALEEIAHNLTDHRIVTNMTFNKTGEIENITKYNAEQALRNQKEYFQPYFNESFNKIFKALNVTDTESAFNISNGHRK